MDALDQYHGTKVSTGITGMGEKNKGKTKLDPQEEYVFELVERDARQGRAFQTKEDKEKGKEPEKVMKAFLIWREVKSGVLVLQSHRIDRLFWGNADGSMKSKVLSFLEDIGMPQPKDSIPHWGSTFVLTMKIRARIIRRMKNDVIVPDEYLFKEGSFRKYQV